MAALQGVTPVPSPGRADSAPRIARSAKVKSHLPILRRFAAAPLQCVAPRSEIYESTAKGCPEPLGPSLTSSGAVNFAVYASEASSVSLVLYNEAGEVCEELAMGAGPDGVWHIECEGMPSTGVEYGYRVSGDGDWSTGQRFDSQRVVLDPYAPLVSGRRVFGQRDNLEHFSPKTGSSFRGTFDLSGREYDWGADYRRPAVAWKDLIIYEMSVRCFTAHESSGLPPGQRGTFAGVGHKVDHLKELGVTAVELLPVFEYDELEFQRSDNPRDHMVNVWGYSHINFMAPMSRFACDGGGPLAAANEFKDMVKALHGAGIEVILDVVYNHTAEGGDDDPYQLSFRGLAAPIYYMMKPEEYVQLLNYSGCGNTVAANHPVVQELILASLRRWVEEFHVDGFRFDLASCLCRDSRGEPLPAPPLIRAIAKDPVLAATKLIAEPWDIGMYQVGHFPNWDVWAEWNGRYRDVIRRFVKGDAGLLGAVSTNMAGSADLYLTNNRKPYHSINFVNCHDGFSLHDMVAYNDKHNDRNGESNRDGSNDNFTWNCGVEGPSQDEGVQALRRRQMRNFMVALMVSQGTPLILMGDEYAATRHGNNNWYGHDQDWTWFRWDEQQRQAEWRSFLAGLIKFRLAHPALGQPEFLNSNSVSWHVPDWEGDSRFLAFTLHDPTEGDNDLLIAFNAHDFPLTLKLPPPPSGCGWCRVADTNLEGLKTFTPDNDVVLKAPYGVQPYSSILLQARRVKD